MRQRKRPLSMYGSCTTDQDKKVTVAGEEPDEGSDYEDDDVYLLKKDDDFYPVKGQAGMYYKVCVIQFIIILETIHYSISHS